MDNDFDGEDTRILVGFLVGFEVDSAEKVVVTMLLEILVPTDEDDVTGGKPKMEPFV